MSNSWSEVGEESGNGDVVSVAGFEKREIVDGKSGVWSSDRGNSGATGFGNVEFNFGLDLEGVDSLMS